MLKLKGLMLNHKEIVSQTHCVGVTYIHVYMYIISLRCKWRCARWLFNIICWASCSLYWPFYIYPPNFGTVQNKDLIILKVKVNGIMIVFDIVQVSNLREFLNISNFVKNFFLILHNISFLVINFRKCTCTVCYPISCVFISTVYSH